MAGVVGGMVDVEGPVKAWLAAVPEVAAAAPGGVFLEIPSSPTYPLLRVVGVVGGLPDPGETPLYSPLIQLDAYGGTRLDAATLAYTAARTAAAVRGPTPLGADLIALSGAVARLPTFDPDPQSGRARYTLDIVLTVRTTT